VEGEKERGDFFAVTQKDRLSDLMHDLSNASGVQLRGPFRDRVDYGGYENQRMTRGTVAFEALNAHGNWETLWSGKESEAPQFLESAKRLFDLGKVEV